MKLAIIDDGVKKSAFPYPCTNLTVVNKNLEEGGESDSFSHATIIANIILKHIKKIDDWQFISLKIMDSSTLKTDISTFITALNWCIENSVSVIHLSVGSVKFYDKYTLRPIINKIIANNILIIAAMSNKYIATYPASYNNIIGVKYDKKLKADQLIYNVDPLDGIDISTGCEKEICGRAIIPCNSYAAAYITGMLLDHYKDIKNSPKDALDYLNKIALNKNVLIELKHLSVNVNIPVFRLVNKTKRNIFEIIKEFSFYMYQSSYNCFTIDTEIMELDENIFKSNSISNHIIGKILYIYNPDLLLITEKVKYDNICVDWEVICYEDVIILRNDILEYKISNYNSQILAVVKQILKIYED